MSTRNRIHDASSANLRPDSLVGSYFLGDGQQGMVVAEPTPGFYLVELATGSTTQRLVGIEAMAEWRFFDTAEWMRNKSEDDADRVGSWRDRNPATDDRNSSEAKPERAGPRRSGGM